MNKVDTLIKSLTPDMIQDLKKAVELGKFPDGHVVSGKQKELMLEAILRYEVEYLEEMERTGYIDRPEKRLSISPDDLIEAREIKYD